MAEDIWDTDDLYHLLSEVVRGIGADRSTLPDTPKVREMREKLVKEVAEIEARDTRSTSLTSGRSRRL